MTNPRPSARTFLGVALASMLLSIIAVPVVAVPVMARAVDPAVVCSAGQLPTRWPDDLHPPTTIRVLRSKGPDRGHVQTVDFWKYVSVVMRAEYSTGADKPPVWMRIGSITVKQYGWYKAMSWGGGRVSFTTTDPGTGATTTRTECFDVKDNTADQIYKPTETMPDGTVLNGNDPTPAIYKAMRETWQITMRKWVAAKSKSRLFLSGYRSGRQVPCGADSTGFKIFQQSLRDCTSKNLNVFETLRRYFEPVYLVNTRDHDMMGNNGDWMGDLGVLNDAGGTSTSWRLYAGSADRFAAPVSGTFDGLAFASLVGYGAGQVDAARSDAADGFGDPALLADLVMVTGDNRVLVSSAGAGGLSQTFTTTTFAGATADRAGIADINGDMLDDVGLVRTTDTGTSSLQVMFAKGDETFYAPVEWWSGAIDVAPTSFVAAGDVNGDGKADLMARDATGAFTTVLSPASCATFATWGACPATGTGGNGLNMLVAALPSGVVPADSTLSAGDFDRDGRSDVFAVSASAGTITALRSTGDGTFAAPVVLWRGAPSAVAGQPVALNVNPDGMADLAVVQDGAVGWFKTNERTTAAASMTLMSTTPDGSVSSASKAF